MARITLGAERFWHGGQRGGISRDWKRATSCISRISPPLLPERRSGIPGDAETGRRLLSQEHQLPAARRSIERG